MIHPRSRSFTARCLLVPCLLLLTAHCLLLTAFGQSATATLSGTVTDQNGAVVPGVSITVLNLATALRRQATTTEQGYFTVPLLPPGTYSVKAQGQGFTPIEVQNVVLNVGDQKALQIQLKAGDINATVQVTNEAPLIDESPAVGTVVNRQFVENMPLNGRSFQSLIALTPGVITTKTQFIEQGQFSVNGQRPTANYFTVDGVSANIGFDTSGVFSQSESGSLPGLGATGGTNNLVSVDALQEFKVQTSTYAPEFGRTPGAQVQIVTRSGTNDFHGTLFDYFRNDVLDANDWFANANRLPKPRERQNDFGGVFSGPVLLPRFGEGGHQPGYNGRNRTFFFFSYEGLRLRQPQTGITTVPSLNARQSAPASMQPFLNAFPVPNGRNLANNFAEFNASFSNPTTLNATSIRVDHTFSPKLMVFGRYNYAPSQIVIRGASSTGLNTLASTAFKTQTITGGATLAITPNVSNELRLNYSRNGGPSTNTIDDFGGATPPPLSATFPSFASPQDSLFGFFVGGGTNTAFTLGKNADNLQRQINLVDTVSVITGAHQLRLGADYRKLSPIFNPSLYLQQPFFNGVNGALSGRALFTSIIAFAGKRFPLFTNLSIFGQDHWKASRRITLTYGVRWEYDPPPSEKNNNNPFGVTGLDNPITIALAPKGTPLYKTTYGNFAPRIGVAFQLSQRKDRETILRGGYGIFYDLGSGQIANAFASSFPNRAAKILFNAPFPLDPSLAAPPSFSLNPPFPAITVSDPNLKLPYTHQWNLAVEQSLGSYQIVSATYVAALGRRLLRNEIFVRPNPNFGSLSVIRNVATSDYHALQLQYTRRLSRGLQALASYTWSHSIDSASSDSANNTPAGIVDPRQDRGPSDFDVRHAFNGAVTYNIPAPDVGSFGKAFSRNWSTDVIITARTPTPVNVITGRNLFGIFAVSRPDLVLGVPLYIDDSSVGGGRRINPAAFALPPLGPGNVPTRQGTLGRNALRGFGIWQADFALRRQFNLAEHFNLQFRAEFFNVFNHPNFGDPTLFGTDTLSNPLFGRSVNMLGRRLGSGGVSGGFNPLYQVGGPRSVQFALKLQF